MRSVCGIVCLWGALALGVSKECGNLLGELEPVGIHPLFSLPLSCQAAQGMKQHVFRGQAVMPGAAFLSNSLLAASKSAPELPIVTLESFKVLAPLLLTDAERAPCLLTQLSSIENRRAKVSCGSRDSSNRPALHAVGELKLGKTWPQLAGEPFPQIPHESVEISPQSLYNSFGLIGLQYGPLFQRVTYLTAHDLWVDALVHPVPGEESVLHPAFLDGVLQTLIAPLVAAGLRGEGPASPRAAVPLFFKQVAWNASLPPDSVYRVQAQVGDGELPDASTMYIKYRLLVTNQQGRPVLQIEEGRLTVLEADFRF